MAMEAYSNLLPLIPSGITAGPEIITPGLAKEWLSPAFEGRDREEIPAVVDFYAAIMTSGGWRLNGEAIIFGRSGKRLNGKQRLNAVLKSGVSIPCIVIRGIEDDAFDTIDTGAGRRAKDVLSIDGVEHSRIVAAAARWRHRWVMKQFRVNPKIANAVVRAVFSSFPRLTQHAQLMVESKTDVPSYAPAAKLLGAGLATFIYGLLSEKDLFVTNALFARLSDGAGLNADDPILKLRDRLQKSQANRRGRLTDVEKLAFTIKTFNAIRNGEKRAILKFTMRGKAQEEMPIPI
jgi:hypothetical protein